MERQRVQQETLVIIVQHPRPASVAPLQMLELAEPARLVLKPTRVTHSRACVAPLHVPPGSRVIRQVQPRSASVERQCVPQERLAIPQERPRSASVEPVQRVPRPKCVTHQD